MGRVGENSGTRLKNRSLEYISEDCLTPFSLLPTAIYAIIIQYNYEIAANCNKEFYI